jgi:hypothetical protein
MICNLLEISLLVAKRAWRIAVVRTGLIKAICRDPHVHQLVAEDSSTKPVARRACGNHQRNQVLGVSARMAKFNGALVHAARARARASGSGCSTAVVSQVSNRSDGGPNAGLL